MQSTETDTRKNLKRSRSFACEMPLTDTTVSKALDDCIPFPVEEIVQYPLPGYGAPTSISFSPDDSLVSYLFSPDYSLNRKLFTFDLKTCKQELFFSPPDGGLDESNISAEEKLRRERLRERGLGITRYEWVKMSSKKKTVMVPLPAGIYFQDMSLQPELKLPSKPCSPIIDPHLSPDGTMLAYVRDYELHVLNLLCNESKQLTFGADDNVLVRFSFTFPYILAGLLSSCLHIRYYQQHYKTHGLAEYIAQEEMDRKNGYWWSMDSKFIAFTQVDSSEIPLFRIMHQGKGMVGPDAQEDHAYPFAGASNVKVRLGVISANGGPVTWMDLHCGEDNLPLNDEEYLARVNWMHENILTAQVLDRLHSKLKILKFDIQTGKRKVIMVEELETWVNLHDCFTPLDKGLTKLFSGGFIWASERTGFRHLYLHDTDGACVGPITEGDWMVEQISGVNEAAGLAPLRLTQGKGRHVVVLDHQLQRFVDIYDSLDSAPRISLCSLQDGSLIMPLYEQPFTIPRFKRLQLQPPELIQIQASDDTILYGAIYKPDVEKFGPPPYKTMVSVYGGPSVQLVSDSWINSVDMRAQYLRSKGVLVWKLDNRGTARRGLKFESALKYNAGRVDAEDQLTGAEWLIKQGLAKVGHIGLYGWSYGGYLSAMTLARFPDVFTCAVSGAPVTSWDGYDTFYTEKYMGLPSGNRESYKIASVMHHVDKIKGKLLIVHGMIDENVHFRHTARLVNALVDAGKPYELLIFPDERHMPRRLRDRIYMEERIWNFIEKSL
ncbi:hypothetical protein C3L33_03352, partial [Rhododendron williamsianum]